MLLLKRKTEIANPTVLFRFKPKLFHLKDDVKLYCVKKKAQIVFHKIIKEATSYGFSKENPLTQIHALFPKIT